MAVQVIDPTRCGRRFGPSSVGAGTVRSFRPAPPGGPVGREAGPGADATEHPATTGGVVRRAGGRDGRRQRARAVAGRTHPRGRPQPVRMPRQRGVPAACGADVTERPYRMGRWSRLSMTIIVAAALVVGVVTLAGPRLQPDGYVTVAPGESLVSIAQREMPGLAPADAVLLIEDANGLADAQVRAGTVLRIPR